MPVTRSLSAQLPPPPGQFGHSDDISMIKARNLLPSSMSMSVSSSSLSTKRTLVGSATTAATPKKSTSSKSFNPSSHGPSRLDSSDDEKGDRNQRRLGGCIPQTLTELDDGNKENVAPIRSVSQQVLTQEAVDAQQEHVVRRTRTRRRSSLMERCSSSSTTTTTSLSASNATCSSSASSLSTSTLTRSMSTILKTPTKRRRMPRTQSDHHLLSTHSFLPSIPQTPTDSPVTSGGKKRSRRDAQQNGGLASDDEDFDDYDVSTLPSLPMSRLHLSPRKRTTVSLSSSRSYMSTLYAAQPLDEIDNYFCSQPSASSTTASSLFDSLSQAGSSSATSHTTVSCTSSPSFSTSLAVLAKPTDKYSNVYAHARALLRYAAGVDPAESESGLTICHQQQLLKKHSENHVKVVGRNQERVAIETFLDTRLGLFPSSHTSAGELGVELDGDSESGCLYVCGLPGTGKTALVRSVLNSISDSVRPPRVAFVNCMTLAHPRLVFAKVLSALGSDAAEGQSDAEAERALSTLIQQGQQRILIVLDEIDQLLHNRAHQNLVYRLFSWASSLPAGGKNGSSCSLIGIANSLDLTERFVPLLISKGHAPAILHFRPFEATEIVNIIKDRLSALLASYQDDGDQSESHPDTLPLFSQAAVELLAKRIAAATGDLRKALDASRLAIELVETEERKKALVQQQQRLKANSIDASNFTKVATESTSATETETETAAMAAAATETTSTTMTTTTATPIVPRARLLSHLTPETAPRVTPKHILQVLQSVLGSPSLSKIRNLGLQPKLILLSYLVAYLRASQGLSVLTTSSTMSIGGTLNSSPTLTLSDLESTYYALLKTDASFPSLEPSELLAVFELLEVQAVLSLSSSSNSLLSCSFSSPNISHLSSNSSPIKKNGGLFHRITFSPSAKKASKKHSLAANRIVTLLVPIDDVIRGITTELYVSSSSSTTSTNNSTVIETISRIYRKEEERVQKARNWQSLAKESEMIRKKELGGGRGSVAGF